MRFFEPHIHMVSRVTDDYDAMALAGVRACVEPAFWLGQPRTHVGTFLDYFDAILEFEVKRAAEHGVDHYATIALNPKEANDPRVANGVIAEIPRYLKHPRCVAVGEVGYDSISPAEDEALAKQVELAIAHALPVLVHTPHRDKRRGTERTIALMKEMRVPPERCLIDHSTEETTRLILEAGFYCGHTVYPRTKLSPERFANLVDEHGTERMMVNSSADWGASDPLSVPKVAMELRRRGYDDAAIERVVWKNPIAFFGASGKLAIDGERESAAPKIESADDGRTPAKTRARV
ncbi:MAG TPA: TatD family hydrolase [Planctomycetota bacterium]|nr:TatD family hydrolase [Planctomycetota bacterium]